MDQKNSIIDLQNISVIFEDGEQVLRDFNLSIRNGEFVTLLGQSGMWENNHTPGNRWIH